MRSVRLQKSNEISFKILFKMEHDKKKQRIIECKKLSILE